MQPVIVTLQYISIKVSASALYYVIQRYMPFLQATKLVPLETGLILVFRGSSNQIAEKRKKLCSTEDVLGKELI